MLQILKTLIKTILRVDFQKHLNDRTENNKKRNGANLHNWVDRIQIIGSILPSSKSL
jgi:hypothetical protein